MVDRPPAMLLERPKNTRWWTGRRMLLAVLYVAAFALLIGLFIHGADYYTSPYAQRPHHEDYRALRPAGSLGLLYGYLGAGMMILMLLYTLRKRTGLMGRRVPLNYLLDFHIFLGVIGPLFIVLHTSFKVQGLVAISFWSMVAVALSGYLGRYLYHKIPRNIDQQELSLKDLEASQQYLSHELQQFDDISPDSLAQIAGVFDRAFTVKGKGAVSMLWHLILSDLRRPLIRGRLHRTLRHLTGLAEDRLAPLCDIAYRRSRLAQRIRVLDRVQSLFHYWHVIHKPFAIIMYLIMLVHIGVAVWTGYGWVH